VFFAVRDFQELAITYFKFFGSFNLNFFTLVILILVGIFSLKAE
jgi:hypothetical protein